MCTYTDGRNSFLSNLAIGDTVLYGDIGDSNPWRMDGVITKCGKRDVVVTLSNFREVTVDRKTGYAKSGRTMVYPSNNLTAEEWTKEQDILEAQWRESREKAIALASSIPVGSRRSDGAIRIV